MKYYTLFFIIFVAATLGCNKNIPIDEDGLLITSRAECFVSNFNLLGTDHVTVKTNKVNNPVIDTVAQTIAIEVKFDTNLKSLYPQFSLAQDCKLEPKITGFTDFSDLNNPKVYKVVSGNRKVKKDYKVIVTVESN